MKTDTRHLLSRIPLGLLCAVFLLQPVLSRAASEFKAVTEYRYPTEFEVTPITVTGPNGVSQVVGGIVTPKNFKTREVGVSISVEASTYAANGSVIDVSVVDRNRLSETTDLMLAATAGEAETVKSLLAKGAPVNAQDRAGSTALMGAAAGGFDAIVKALLDREAQANTKNKDGATALMFAARNGHEAVAKTLIEHGAEVQAADGTGMTPLHYASKGGHADVVKLLLANGASAEAADKDGRTALALASARKDGRGTAVVMQMGASK